MNNTATLNSMLNSQIQKEFESAYLYLEFSAFFDAKGLTGFSRWYRIQAKEEETHGLKILDYLNDTNQKISLLPIEEPKIKPESIPQILKKSLEHEEYITKLISELYFQTEKEKNLFAKSFLNWFISEQLEEEQNARNMIERFEMFGATSQGLYELDRELGMRKGQD